MRSVKLVALLLLTGVSAAACASGKAQVIEDRPTLAVPPVPARTIEPQPTAELPPVAPVPESNPAPASSPKPKPTARNNNEPRAADPKPETPEATAAAATPPPPPVAPLRTLSTPSGVDALRQARDTITRAEGILSQVDYKKLSPDRQKTYDGAKNFITQAEEKIKQEDFALALSFAQRAETIAKILLDTGR